jgi:hypothetical protein
MATAQIEYIGFTATGAAREYKLRVRQGADSRYVTIAISNEAFLAHRVRYQDAPDVCFLKVQRELTAGGGVLAADRFDVADEELAAYRVAHTAKPQHRGTKPPVVVADAQGAPEETAARTEPAAPGQGFRSWS